MVACSGYGPCADDEAYGWLTYVGSLRFRYATIRPGRNLWRLVTWERKWPEAFRGESRVRTIRPLPREAAGG